MTEAEPIRWQVCFLREAENRWVNALVPGRFKHVRAFGFVPVQDLWIFYDVTLTGTAIRAARDHSAMADRLIAAWIDGAEVICVQPQRGRRRMPCGFWCVTAIVHLLGLSGSTLLPDQLHRECLRLGKPMEPPNGALRPDGGRQDCRHEISVTAAAAPAAATRPGG